MDAEVGGSGGTREILTVLGVAFCGLFLAALAAFTPWYAAGVGAGAVPVVEMYDQAGTGSPAVQR